MTTKVLIVEDNPNWQDCYAIELESRVSLIQACTLREAFDSFYANPDVAVVVVDGCIESGEIDTIPLVKMIRETFRGPIIASAACYGDNVKLMDAGCDRKISKKDEVPAMVLEILKL